MKTQLLFRWACIGVVALVAFYLGGMGYAVFDAVSPQHGLLIVASDGALVRVDSVERGAVEFLAGTGGVTFFARPMLPAATALFAVLVIFAFRGASSMFRHDKRTTQAA